MVGQWNGAGGRCTQHARARAHTHVAGGGSGGGGGEQLRGFGIFNGSSGQPDQCVAANWLREDVPRLRHRRSRRRSRSSLRFVFFLIYFSFFFTRRVVFPCPYFLFHLLFVLNTRAVILCRRLVVG